MDLLADLSGTEQAEYDLHSRTNTGRKRRQEGAPERYNQVHDPFKASEQGSSSRRRNSHSESPRKMKDNSFRSTNSDGAGMSLSTGNTSFDPDGPSRSDDDISLDSMTGKNKRTKIYAALVVLIGLGASIAFVVVGIQNHNKDSEESFDRRSSELVQVIKNAFQDYETAVRNTHSVCRRERNTSRYAFQEHYEYLVADGMDFQAIQCAPNVTHPERAAMEAEALAFYEKEYPTTVNYVGFKGFEMNPETGSVGIMPRSEADFYFPIHYSEPVIPNAGAVGLDIYSSSMQYREIDLAVATREPVLSARLKLVQDTSGAYSVIIRHPGIQVGNNPEDDPVQDIACLLVRLPSLLTRVALIQEESLAAYAYDTTEFNTGGTTDFLGAAEYTINRNGETGKMDTVIAFPKEIEIADLQSQHEDSAFFYEESIPIASGTWKIVVVPVDNTYEPDLALVWFSGAMILLSALGLSAYLVRNMFQLNHIYEAKQEAEAERNIVASLFPDNVIKQLMQDAEAKREEKKERKKNRNKPIEERLLLDESSKAQDHSGEIDRRNSIAMDGRGSSTFTSVDLFGGKPIAEFHPSVTILYANLCGFTAWASVREPAQVFTLLETIFHSFDMIAKRRRVFKVETIGDCYVAAAGVPEPRANHAVIMARFATDIMNRVRVVAHELEKTLGPETGDIDLRIGLHSGAVTAGVLRGDKGRFQLFGNTFNITQHMETSGTRGRIQASSDTRDLLEKAGKGSFLTARAGKIAVRGKGQMQTYFVESKPKGTRSKGSMELATPSTHARPPVFARQLTGGGTGERLVDWSVRELTKLLRTVMARRAAKSKAQLLNSDTAEINSNNLTPLEEVKDVITLPKFDAGSFTAQYHTKEVKLERKVDKQLHKLVTKISTMYQSNPFHNFEHASHVAMSVTKMLSRIGSPKDLLGMNQNEGALDFEQASKIHEYTFGITSDPLTHFAAFFAALIHDADHCGIPNSTLITENPTLAFKYSDTSVAEQNSLDLCWDLFMQDAYADLRGCICADVGELAHFRELLIVMVMSTDVMDKNLNNKRKARWNLAFSDETKELRASDDDRNRKATIIIEHLIQASDVSHTMQHWNIYSKWNRRLFMELYHAYQEGRMDKDPSEMWYQGEIGFLDFYVIPLAKKLDTCGVFGVSSDEFAFYASENRTQWEVMGKDMVQEYLEDYHSHHSGATKGKSLVVKEEEGSTQMEEFSEEGMNDDSDSDDFATEIFSDEISC